MEINPRQNGIHSLAEALKAFEKYHENPDDVFALKDSILRSHHALETLFKHILYLVNPTLLVDEDTKIKRFLEGYKKWSQGKIATPLDELKTVNLEGGINRLRQFGLFKDLSKKEYELFYDSVSKLSFYRNKLQHFSLSADPDVVGRILGNVLPRAVDVLHPFFSNPPPFFTPINLIEECKKFFPKAQSIIELLRHDYDRLIQEAVKFFRGTAFNDQILNLKIVDHGRVGAPPYFPEITTEGFLDFKYDMRTAFEIFRTGVTEGEAPYSGKIQISQPKFTADEARPGYGVAEGSLELNARIVLERADKSLILPNAEEKIAVLRGLTITIKASLDYKADALMTEAHYDCRKIQEATGELRVRLTAIPKGYKSEEVELIGLYQSDLNKENAPFRLHSFLEPDGSLKEDAPRTLEWSINTKENLSFK